jgi:hypothetical protein
MESKLSMIMSENENSTMQHSELLDHSVVRDSKCNKKANKVRTTLLVQVNSDSTAYLRNSTVMLNSELPKDIIKKFDQFEKKFDNPLIMGSVRGDNRFNTAKLDKNASDILKQKIKTDINKLHSKNSDVFLEQEEANPLDFAEFLEKKKITCAHKKIKVSENSMITNKKSIKKSGDISQYGSSNNRNSSTITYNTFNSGGRNIAFLTSFLNEEERRKLKILEGYDKLRSTARVLVPLKKKKKIKTKEQGLLRQYDELFELLEYKGINFKSKNDVRENLFGNKNEERNKKKYYYPSSCSPKRKSREDVSVESTRNKKEKSKKDILNKGDNQQRSFSKNVVSSIPTSGKKNSVPLNLNLKPPRINSDQKHSHRYSTPSSKFHSEANSKMSNNMTSSSNLNSMNNKFVYERHPNSVSPPVKIKPTKLTEEIDYDNYRNTLNTSVIQVKDDEDNSIIVSENHNSNHSNSSSIINLKPIEVIYNRENFSSLSQIQYTSGEVQDFISNNNQNFMTGMTAEYTTSNYRTKNTSHAIDNYEEFENLMNKMHTGSHAETSLFNNLKSNYSNYTNTNNGESEYVTNSVNTSMSHNSNITKSLSFISKSSADFDY